MTKWRFSLVLACLLAASALAADQSYPQRPIRIITSEIGGSGDFVIRLLAQGNQGLTDLLGQPLIIDNRATSVIPDIMSRATPDGYTLLVIGAGFWNSTLLHKKMPYDPLVDFSPIVMLNNAPQVFVVNSALPVKSVKELIALAKAKPGELNYAYTILGTPVHVASELFKSMAGVNIVAISYKGTAQMLNALLSGEVQLIISPVAAALPQIKSGRLRALAITSPQSSALLPEVPTAASSGLPGYEIGNINGMFGPAKTPTAIINQVNRAAVQAVNRQDVKDKLLSSGVEPVGSTTAQFIAAIRADMARMSKVVKDSNLHID